MQARWTLGFLMILTGLVLSGSRTQEEGAQGRKPVPPRAAPTAWIPAPGIWEETERADVPDRRGTVWRLDAASRPIGKLSGPGGEVEVRFPRVRIRRIAGAETLAVGVLLPIDNRSVALFAPESGRDTMSESELVDDGLGRWPNLCNISLLDATGELDVDADGAPEVALRRFCSCPAMDCSGIVLLELRAEGPELLDPASLVDGLYLGHVTVERIDAGEEPSRPILRVSPTYLEDCRFIAAAGIAGAADCAGCCSFSVFLRPIQGGAYEPYYDRESQSKLLERSRYDLSYVAAGNSEEPLAPFEKTQVARAASFFFLTGTGAETRSLILQGLGPRAINHHVQELAVQLDRFFRPDQRSRD